MSGTEAMSGTLSQWLRLLWDVSPPLRLDSDCACIVDGAIHLPRQPHWRQHAAAAAHAAAHLVYSPGRFDGTGLGPIARVLMALLEDARVEALALREFPGFARLWRPLHTATPSIGADFGGLLQRLARSLADPGYDDPDAWVRKGRRLFFLDAQLGLLALRTPAEVRTAALQLGHDIGQMRLAFDAKNHRPLPEYRDDHRWMWAADAMEPAGPPPSPADAVGSGHADDALFDDLSGSVHVYSEWDRLIGRLRPDWCRVVEQVAPEAAVDADAFAPDSRALRSSLHALMDERGNAGRADTGDSFVVEALVDLRIARRLGVHAEPRACRARPPRHSAGVLWILIDQSASSRAGALSVSVHAASAIAQSLAASTTACAIASFSSAGRHATRLQKLKAFDEPPSASMRRRLRTLAPIGSTRIGAALRHATQALSRQRRGPRWLLLLSDGEAHDIDVHDPLYLPEDARHAIREARQHGVHVACLLVAREPQARVRRLFGAATERLADPTRLGPALRRLAGRRRS